MEEIAKMTSKRIRNVNSYIERNNQEAMHVRNKSTIAALNDLMKDIALVKYRKTLDEVAKAMTRALESDQKWSVKCQELQAELAATETKLTVAMQLSEGDKNVITLKKELQHAWDIIEEMKIWNGNDAKQQYTDNGDVCGSVTVQKTTNDPISEMMVDDKYKFLNEIEKGKLQIFELEEELANKEKIIEELTNSLKLKSKEFKNSVNENAKLKLSGAESEMLINKLQNTKIMLNKRTQADDIDLKHDQILKEQVTLKKQLHDCNKKDEISLQKLKHFLKKNNLLSRNLQSMRNENSLMKLQLVEQTRILDLLSEKCCKFEEKDTKQSATIFQLKSLRDKYVCVIGNLEQKIHEMKKKRMLKN